MLIAAVDAGVTTVHPLALAVLLPAVAVILLAPTRFVLPSLFSIAVLLPSAQRIVIVGADFNFVRICVLAGLVRMLARGGARAVPWGAIDACVAVGMVARVACAPVTFGGLPALAAALGASIDGAGAYILARCCIRSLDDLRAFATATVLLSLPIAGLFIYEHSTGRNLLHVFGGVPEFTRVREDKLRCRGAFSHAILAGCFFVAMLPIWVSGWREGIGRRVVAAIGVSCALLIVFACASSTPVVALLVTAVGFAAYPAWRMLRPVWIAALACGVVLNFLMTHGVWHLISRIDLVGGSTGYHRYNLIDKTIRNFDEWWLAGVASTAHWARGLSDITNQYVLEGVRGGIWAMAALVLAIVFALRGIGRALRATAPGSSEHLLAFSAGVSMVAQGFIFLAVSYFGQTIIVWSITLAVAALWSERTQGQDATPRDQPESLEPLQLTQGFRPDRRLVEPLPMLGTDPEGGRGGR